MTTMRDTTVGEVVQALAARRRSVATTRGMAFTLVVVTKPDRVPEVQAAARTAAARHPFRLLVVGREASSPSRLDADISVSGGPETVTMSLYGELAENVGQLVVPLLAADLPVVVWWFGVEPDDEGLASLANRRITDAAQGPSPIAALLRLAERYRPGDTDLAWARLTPWRSLLVRSLDTVTDPVVGAMVTAAPDDPCAALLRGWLYDRLGVIPALQEHPSGVGAVVLQLEGGDEVPVRGSADGSLVQRMGGQAARVDMAARDLGDLLSEELRYRDEDALYAGALRGAARLHVGRPPTQADGSHDALRVSAPETQ